MNTAVEEVFSKTHSLLVKNGAMKCTQRCTYFGRVVCHNRIHERIAADAILATLYVSLFQKDVGRP
jgi:hypothetical protein